MEQSFLSKLFGLERQVAVVTGGTGVLGGAMARGLAQANAKVGVLGRREQAEAVVAEIEAEGGQALAVPADVLRRDQLEAAAVRQQGIASLDAVEAVVLETDSSLSVIKRTDAEQPAALMDVAGYTQHAR